jgi:3-oxoacyl-(acyl-carrier-protein) synthase/malonyl CoA-acyl carrier protein transacylase
MSASRARTDGGGGTVFVFGGQGSYDDALLRALDDGPAVTRDVFDRADEAAQRWLGAPFRQLLASDSADERRAQVEAFPDLLQLGIFVGGVAAARFCEQEGLRPDVLVGHSVGELAALCAAGVFDLATGLEMVCRRALVLRATALPGGMAAVGCGPEAVGALLHELRGHSIEIAVVNHPRQTVVSGPRPELEDLARVAGRRGVSLTVLKSPHPFHSSHLAESVAPFAASLRDCAYGVARVPVFSAMEGRLVTRDLDLHAVLASHLARRLDFAASVHQLHAWGFDRFLEMGASSALSKVVLRNVAGADRVVVASPALETTTDGSVPRVRCVVPNDAQPSRTAPPPAGARPPVAADRPVACEEPQGAGTAAEAPLAVVAMGCVLPGAVDADQFWRNVLEGRSGIVDLAELDPCLGRDFVDGRHADRVEPVSDKTYTLLNGAIRDVPYDAARLGRFYEEPAFARLTRGQQLLARALAEALASGPAASDAGDARIRCLLGATADGSSEYDDALFAESVSDVLGELEVPEARREAFARRLASVPALRSAGSVGLRQHELYRDVVSRLAGPGVRTCVVDSACSSSLYAVALGARALCDGEADLVLAGGVFAPGPANNALFAQFRGLTPHASRPLDVAADGVVFGDGAAVVVLERLADALRAGHAVLGVIRAIGLSSDGKSPAINVPQPAGQSLAMRRAYARAALSPDTVQLIEAHATATPVGDAVEVRSLEEVFGGRSAGLPRVQLGSVKSLVGHTGWVSGVASLIKVLQAFRHRTIPPQHNFTAPHPSFQLEASAFEISTAARPWPANPAGCPPRAGINGFGFGGTNAHLVVEAFDEAYHRELCGDAREPSPAAPELVVVGVASLFPAGEGLDAEAPQGIARFRRAALRLPAGRRLLPDVTDHMDASQFLTALAAERILSRLPAGWVELRDEVAVVVGLEGKTERGVRANERIFRDRLLRLMAEAEPVDGARPETDEVLTALSARLRERNLASGPYTLSGLMPNVAASRVSSVFDLKGPNLVVDRGGHSLFEALRAASALVRHGDCLVALAGALNASGATSPAEAEGVLMLALASEATAREKGLPVLARLAIEADEEREAGAAAAGWRGANGAAAVLAALERVQTERSEKEAPGGGLVLRPPVAPAPAVAAPRETHAYVQETAIESWTPTLVASPALAAAGSLAGRRWLVLVDQPELWAAVLRAGVLTGVPHTVVCPSGAGVAGALALDAASEEGWAAGAGALRVVAFDAVLALKSLAPGDAGSLLTGAIERETRLLDLLFAVCRHAYEPLVRGEAGVYTLCLGAFAGALPQPYTGLLGGFVKSLARELPAAVVKSVHTDASDPHQAFEQLATELAQPREPVEVCWRGGTREVFALAPVPELAADASPCLGPDSVVLATGGGRGVTAVLVEELLCRFGATVVAVGRTDPDAAPPAVAGLDAAAFADLERSFFRDELARDPGQKIVELKRRLATYQEVNELHRNCRRFQGLRGRFEYRRVDIQDDAAVRQLVDGIYDRHGRIDLVLHGAGVQVSRALPKKSVEDFRRIVRTKLGSLGSLHRACSAHPSARPVHFHLLSSAFSYLGNDGQPDYGAANEALNRLAASQDDAAGAWWSSMAWLGWAGIGMTRGSEFAALAASRRLRGVTHDEGRALFGRLMAGRPGAAVNVLLAEGEKVFYGPRTTAAPAAPDTLVMPLEISLENAPYLRDHLVHVVPTLPGALLLALAAEAVKRLRPRLHIVAFENTSFLHFVRVHGGKETRLRFDTRIVEQDGSGALARVRVLSDFVHKSGAVLQRDVVQTEIFVRLSATAPVAPARRCDFRLASAVSLPDPYVLEASPVRLNGRFNSLRGLEVAAERRVARYELRGTTYPDSPLQHLLPNVVLVDAFWRFGTVMVTGARALSVYVPERCDRMSVYFDYTDFESGFLHEPLLFTGENPRPQGDQLFVGPIEAWDRHGRLRLTVEGGVCRRFGEIRDAF